jgi:hypothetical protein
MRRTGKWSKLGGLVLVTMLAALFAGCAQDIEDIDRTQPDKLEKELFQTDDEWYYRQTIIDSDMQGSGVTDGQGTVQGYAFKALESSLKRIRWEITEDVLWAYSTVPLVDGIQDEHTDEDSRRLGAVAAFPITDHFDVIRQYNPQTGEQTNVIVEDRSDRPWYEREYMRVDWNNNLVDGYGMFDATLGRFSATNYDPPQDDNRVDPNRARIGSDYIDVTTQYTFQPDIMSCAYNVGVLEAIYNCEAGKVRARSSFVRIEDDQKTYEPFTMTDNHHIMRDEDDPQAGALYSTSVYDPVSGYYMDVECDEHTTDFLRDEYGSTDEQCSPASFGLFSRFGYFRTDRMRWNEEYPGQDTDRMHFANRWNVWQSAYDEDGQRLELSERTPKPIVYHLNAEYPRDMMPAAQEVAQQWDVAFLEAIRIAKGYESVDDVRDELEAEYGDRRMFKILPNSCLPEQLAEWKSEYGSSRGADRRSPQGIFDEFVGAGDGQLVDALWDMPKQDRVQLCAELEWATETRGDEAARFSYERLGDLRYSFFNWVDEFNGFWSGYGPSAADPLTGEIISGNANFSGTPLRSTATSAANIIQYINGELDERDVRTGEHVREYITELREEQRQQALEPKLPTEARQELARRAGKDLSDVDPLEFEKAPPLEDQDPFIKKWGRDRISQEADRLSQTITQAKQSDTRLLEFLDDPRVKQVAMSDADFQMAVNARAKAVYGPDPDEHALHQAYLDLADPKSVHLRTNRFDRLMSERNIFTLDSLDRAVTSLITYEGAAEAFKGMDHDEIRRYMMDNAFIGTQLHEVGHTVGLRHNFGASMDALNYQDGYWEIQKALLEGTLEDGDGVTVTPSGTVHITDPDIAAQYTDREDVDYVSTTEMRLASIMDYTGDLTGRFAGLGKYDKAAVIFAYGEHVEQWKSDIELPNLLWYEEWTRDYSALPAVYANDPASTDPQVLADGIDVMLNGREWVPISDAIAERREGLLQNSEDWSEGNLSRNNEPYIDRTVPYEFCSDDFRDSRLGCDVFDWGANQTEVVNHAFNQYRFFQPFWRYRGHSNDRLFNVYNRYISRMLSTVQIAERPFRYYSIYQWWNLGAYTADLERASIDALNFYAEVLATPEPNRYCLYGAGNEVRNQRYSYNLNNKYVPNGWLRDRTNCDNPIDVERGPGQYFGFSFTDEYEYRIDRVGTFIDKDIVTLSLFDISANYAFSSFFTDFRASNISYWTLFEDELNDFMRGMILGDYDGFGGVFDAVEQKYEPPVVVDIDGFGKGITHPQEGLSRVYVPHTLNTQYFSTAYGLLFNSTWQDRSTDFAQYLKVAVTQDELQPFADWVDVATFEHPVTGQVYHAPQTADGKSISYDMVEWANRLKDEWVDLKEDFDEDVDQSNIQPGSDTYERRWEELRDSRRAFEDVVAKLEMTRELFDITQTAR